MPDSIVKQTLREIEPLDADELIGPARAAGDRRRPAGAARGRGGRALRRHLRRARVHGRALPRLRRRARLGGDGLALGRRDDRAAQRLRRRADPPLPDDRPRPGRGRLLRHPARRALPPPPGPDRPDRDRRAGSTRLVTRQRLLRGAGRALRRDRRGTRRPRPLDGRLDPAAGGDRRGRERPYRPLPRPGRRQARRRGLQADRAAGDRRRDPRRRPGRPLGARLGRGQRGAAGLLRARRRLPALLGRAGDAALGDARGRQDRAHASAAPASSCPSSPGSASAWRWARAPRRASSSAPPWPRPAPGSPRRPSSTSGSPAAAPPAPCSAPPWSTTSSP